MGKLVLVGIGVDQINKYCGLFKKHLAKNRSKFYDRNDVHNDNIII